MKRQSIKLLPDKLSKKLKQGSNNFDKASKNLRKYKCVHDMNIRTLTLIWNTNAHHNLNATGE